MQHMRRESGYSLIEIMIVVAIIGVVSVIAVPMFGNMMANFRVTGDARGVSNSIAVAKMRAAANFTRVRLYVDLDSGSHHLQVWDKDAAAWVNEGGITYLSQNVSFDFGVVGTPPPNTQATIGQASKCLADDGSEIDGTACVMFNSRGVPIDTTFAPTNTDAIYLTDGTGVYAITVGATGMLRSWRTQPTSIPSWSLR
jgi:prepilin-type N-terminal cleavage/methylation domain-containing protein